MDKFPIEKGTLLLRPGRVFDPRVNLDRVADLLIVDGKIAKIGPKAGEGFEGEVVNLPGAVIVPGFFDMHVHLREPGREDEETIESGCLSAAAGGFTEIACMPNTQPPIDERSRVEFVLDRAKNQLVTVHPIAAVTKGQQGEELTEMADLIEAGAVAFSDDGRPIDRAVVLRRALEYLKMFCRPLISHCEDLSLSEGGMMNEGVVSAVLGFQGIPPLSEESGVVRDLLITEYTGGVIHIAHVSTARAVRWIREAKARGVKVTAETCPHYLVLTEEAVRSFDPNTKMNPPLRTESDSKALWEALNDGTLDVLATDHAPHSDEEKDMEFQSAPFGIIGLETAVGILLTYGVHQGRMKLNELVYRMAIAPRKILGIPENLIQEGAKANLTFLQLDLEWQVDKNRFFSKSRNTPFHDWKLKGAPIGVYNNKKLFLHPMFLNKGGNRH